METKLSHRFEELAKKHEKDLAVLDALSQWASNPTSASAGYALEENIPYIRANLESRYGSKESERAITCLKTEMDSLIEEFRRNYIYQLQKGIGEILIGSTGNKLRTAILRRFKKLSPDKRKIIAIFASEFLRKGHFFMWSENDYFAEEFKALCCASSVNVESLNPFSTLVACGVANKLLWVTTKGNRHEPFVVPDFAKPILGKMLDEALAEAAISDVRRYVEQLVETKMFEQLRLLDELLHHNFVGDGSILNAWTKDLYKAVSARGIVGKYRTLVAISPLAASQLASALTDVKLRLASELKSKVHQSLLTLRDECFPQVEVVETHEGWVVDSVGAVPLTVTVESWLLDDQVKQMGKNSANLAIVTNESLPSISASLELNKVNNANVLVAAEGRLFMSRFGGPHEMAGRIFSKLQETGYRIEPLKPAEEVRPPKEPTKAEQTTVQVAGEYEITFDTSEREKKVFGRGELEDKLSLGYEIHDDQVKYDRIVTLDLHDLNRPHFAALQQVGMGKSTLAGSIVLQAAVQGIPVVVFDPKPDYISNLVPVTMLLEKKPAYTDKVKPRFDNLKQDMKGFDFTKKIPIHTRNEEMQLELNVFSFNEKLRSIQNVKVLKMPLVTLPVEEEDFESACGHIATNLANVISSVTHKNYRELNIVISKSIAEYARNHPDAAAITYDQFIDQIDELIKKSSNKSEKTDLQKLTKATSSFYLAQAYIFAKSEKELVNFGEIIKNPSYKDGDRKTVSISVIDVSSLSQEKKSPMLSNYVSEVCNQILKFIRKKRSEKPVQLVVIFDEAQNYLPRPTDAYSGVRKILDMGRSLGIRAWIISPSPGNIEQRALDQIATFICAKLRPEQIRPYIANLVSNDEWTTKMQQTETGRALVFNEKAKPSGQLILPFTTPQTVNLLRPEEVAELIGGTRERV